MDPALYGYLVLYVVAVLFSVYMVFLGGRESRRRRIVVAIKCLSCDRIVYKEFDEGDYVGRLYTGYCGGCGDGVVDAIYEEDVEPVARRLFGSMGGVKGKQKQ